MEEEYGNHEIINISSYSYSYRHTWFDRDLSLAGKIILRNKDGTMKEKLVNIEKYDDYHCANFSFFYFLEPSLEFPLWQYIWIDQ